MIGFRSHVHGDWKLRWELVIRLLISCFLALQSQLALVAVPRYLSFLPLLAMLPISGVVMMATLGLGRCCRGLFGISAYAPALVLFHTLFLWGAYISVIREAVPSLLDAAMNVQCPLLMFGLYRIIFSDPGVVTDDYSNPEVLPLCSYSESKLQSKGSFPLTRVRYCRICSANVLGFDHHCPAFGNCIGQKNHRLFMALLVGFIISEASYAFCSINLPGDLVVSTLLFSLLQIFWQVIFLTWHIYCICFNIRTDEWINWRKYPEFHVDSPCQPASDLEYRNPYDNGVVCNIQEFLRPKAPTSSN
ncbi:unnamed protein product [Spirodela intermedia]|uniref:S-acyltransferase n=1 Tax=Spirodela intermedia TaxID=51605 RepID=A0A7I8ICP5_SPIIN|nr:unnamed protein product [Spirodela intermedia]CAA6655391.1 unnamed protein product [Spirodela intermedia]